MQSQKQIAAAGVVIAGALLVAAVWASDASMATSLALTGLLVLVGAVGVGAFAAGPPARDASDEQRDRLEKSVP